MSTALGGRSNAPLRQSLLKRIFLSPLGIIYRVWTFSIRLRYADEEDRIKVENYPEPVLFILWHNRLFIGPEWHSRFRKKRHCYGLISGSRDGAWLEAFYSWAGIRAVRGSRNRRGTQAIRDLVKVVREGNDVGITPDGSRGPRYQAKSGALALAKITKNPVLLLTFKFSSAIRLKTWDEFRLPLPFSSVKVTSKFLDYDYLFENRTLDEATQVAESELNRLTED